jgi:hypothetical protein
MISRCGSPRTARWASRCVILTTLRACSSNSARRPGRTDSICVQIGSGGSPLSLLARLKLAVGWLLALFAYILLLLQFVALVERGIFRQKEDGLHMRLGRHVGRSRGSISAAALLPRKRAREEIPTRHVRCRLALEYHLGMEIYRRSSVEQNNAQSSLLPCIEALLSLLMGLASKRPPLERQGQRC